MANETMNNYVQPVNMSAVDFIAGRYGTFLLTGTNAKTGSFAGFEADTDTVIASIKINGQSIAPATVFGSASVSAGKLRSVAYGRGDVITEITLTSGSLLLINAQ